MNSRERLQAALDHRQPDRVPVDIGATFVTGIHVSVVHQLRQRLPWSEVPVRLIVRQRKRELVRAAAVRGHPWRTTPTETEVELPAEEFISKEVDPILDKISAHGMQSLTPGERKILEAARNKMERR